MQKWEYRTISRTRGWKEPQGRERWHRASSWNQNIEAMLPQLGEEGWELVAISSRSSTLGGYFTTSIGSGDMAGFTDEETWVFKRPKP